MHKRSTRLTRIARHHEHLQTQESRKLSDLRDAVDQAEQQLASLEQYLSQYRDELEQLKRSGATVSRLQHYLQFIARINDAVREQRQRVALTRNSFESQRELWLHARTRTRSLEQAAERAGQQERVQLERSEQRSVDDMVAAWHVHRGNES
ncbi:MAG: flagellar export protein FliJ [Wenzhouxiangellaceae bacterium]|nr:flagellar export protein FliJ [Wenzhouxiangellaceae bacterium]